ncbi:SDR family NAD(P)-dependent oxidoreductase [Clostridium sp. MCC353]|uniref:SDR family oxidoreductase n=1 Tax=Clostridium sp. MCC353 TaxID=2592646 RepID=UPI001C027F2B|nr:SDR family oxidoreductase [Clostridium sp. MCC353]MBT9778770.1 SDR family NAD(P)-dependent oxidoreductase [Clostridium sp. MCC353]
MKGSSAIVTGAGRGIGRAAMAMLVKEGLKVAAVSRSREALEAAVRDLGLEDGTQVAIIPSDLSEEEGAVKAVSQAVKRLGHVDYLINCAGVSQRESCEITQISRQEFERIMNTNLNSVLYMCREFLKYADSGYIINILSTAAYDTGAGGIMYSASKYAARSVTEGLAKSLKGTGVRITSVSPGPVNTDIWSHKAAPVPEERKAKMLKPEDIADIMKFLLNTDDNVQIHDIKVEPWFYRKNA